MAICYLLRHCVVPLLDDVMYPVPPPHSVPGSYQLTFLSVAFGNLFPFSIPLSLLPYPIVVA